VSLDGTPLNQLLTEPSIFLAARAIDRDDAVRQAGAALVATGAVDPSYVSVMLEREKTVSTYLGEGVAIPHGTLAVKGAVVKDALVFLRFPKGVDWGGEVVTIVIGIAATANRHIAIVSHLATLLMDPATARAVRAVTEARQVYTLLGIMDGQG
jgi:PTS system mannitol-specific IIA component